MSSEHVKKTETCHSPSVCRVRGHCMGEERQVDREMIIYWEGEGGWKGSREGRCFPRSPFWVSVQENGDMMARKRVGGREGVQVSLSLTHTPKKTEGEHRIKISRDKGTDSSSAEKIEGRHKNGAGRRRCCICEEDRRVTGGHGCKWAVTSLIWSGRLCF